MQWLALGVLYSISYGVAGYLWRDHPVALSWIRAAALLVPPLTGTTFIVIRRQTWTGCQWLFWATIGLGLSMSAVGLTGWAFDELFFGHHLWLAWPAVFALFGNVAPLFALMAQPHRGARERLAATTAVDIAGLAVVTGFLYSFFVTSPDGAGNGGAASISLLLVSELQAFVVAAGLITGMWNARGTEWHETYRRLALGSLVSLITLTLSNLGSRQGGDYGAVVYDFTWILPFAFYPWALEAAPPSASVFETAADRDELTRPRPWVIFAAVAFLPFMDYGLRRFTGADGGFRDLSTAVTIISVLPLLVARIATERAELQQAGGTTRLLAEVIEQAQDLILVLAPDGRCRHANRAFCRAIGLTREELADRRAQDLLADDSVTFDEIHAAVLGSGTWHGALTRTRPGGSTFPVAASVASIADEHGQPTFLVSVERDMSEERRLREQLIHSERLSAVGQLVAGVAHELNNPLQSVIGTTELLIEAERREDTRRDLELVRACGYRAARIIRNLLAFARRSALERSLAELNELARATVTLKAYELRGANVTLVERYADDLPPVLVNREEIQQVVLNLVSNAQQAILGVRRQGTIEVRTGTTDNTVWLEIVDDGPGVPKASAGRIFEPFFTTKDVGQGTGLGLSISLGIAEAHGGSLVLASTDTGACFRMILPAVPRTTPAGVPGGAAVLTHHT